MRDVIFVSLMLFLSTCGFFVNINFKKTYKTQGIIILTISLLIMLINYLYNISALFSILLLLSAPLGYVLAFLNPLVYFNIASFFFAGAFCLSSHSNQPTMIFCLLVFFIAGYILKNYFKPNNGFKFSLFISVGLVIYNILTLVTVKYPVFNGLMVGLIYLILGSIVNKKFAVLLSPILIVFAVYFSYILFPDLSINLRKEVLKENSILSYNFRSESDFDSIVENSDDLILVETWHQYCNACFESMNDFHPYFNDKENQYNFKHYYVFVGSDLTDTAIYNFKRLPPSIKNVVIDSSQVYYKALNMQGAPYFNFYKNGTYLFSYSGYEEKYKSRYEKAFNDLISKYSKQ